LRSFHRKGLATAIATAAMLFGGCTSDMTPSSNPAAVATISPSDLADAIRFRTSSGLRSDQEWITNVASDPRSRQGVAEFGVPLLPEELPELAHRAANSDAVFDVVQAYGQRYPEDFAGVFVDNAGTGAVVALFSGELPSHEADLRALVNPRASLEIRQARWSLSELERFKELVDGDQAWLPTIDASFIRSQVIPQANSVELRISSADPSAADVVVRHYEGGGWLHVISDGIGPWGGPTGSLVVRAVIPAGVIPERSYVCHLIPDEPAAFPDPGVQYDIDDQRECRFNSIGATGYRVQLLGDGSTVVGEARVQVRADASTTVEVTVEKPKS